MNKKILKYLVVSIASICIVSVVKADITIANNGNSKYVIIISSKAPDSVKSAAKELQKDIKLASEASLSIKDGDVTSSKNFISLGQTKQAKAAGFNVDDIPVEGWRIVTKDGNLYILGPDTPDGQWTPHGGKSNGTANGVHTFLRNTMGVRWLMPGDLGRVVPKQSTLTIEDMDNSGAPRFHYRYMSYIRRYVDNHAQWKAINQWKNRMGVGTENSSMGGLHTTHNWLKTINRSGIDGTKPKYTNHVDTPAMRDMYKKHPDWFAMDAQGKRPAPKNYGAKLETTNQELVQWFADQAIKHMKAQGARHRSYSLSPSDGRGWSQSPASKALYDPSAAEQFHNDEFNHHPSVSPLILKWYHDVSKIVEKEYPQGWLSGFIYSDFVYPPTKGSMKLPENFTPMLCGVGTYHYKLYSKENQKLWTHVVESWAKVAPKRWYYYDLPNDLGGQNKYEVGQFGGGFPAGTGLPTPVAPNLLNYIFHTLVKNHIDGAEIYGFPTWSSSAIKNYVNAQMLWDPTQDAQDVEQDWLDHAYGKKAGAIMNTFYQKLNVWLPTYWQKHPKDTRHELSRAMLKDLYAAHYPEMKKLYLQAKSQEMTPRQTQRLQLIGDNLIVLQWRLHNAGFLPANYHSKLTRTNAQVVDILSEKNNAFPMFPGVVGLDYIRGYRKYKPAKWKVKWADSPSGHAKGKAPKLAKDTVVFYAKKDTTVRINPKKVQQSIYFASYNIKDAAGNILKQGVFVTGLPVSFKAKANHTYFLYIPRRNNVDYVLGVQDAGMAAGKVRGKTLYLHGSTDAPIQLLTLGDWVGAMETDNGLEIVKPIVGGHVVASWNKSPKYKDARLLASITSGWKIHKDPHNRLIDQGVTKLNFNDSTWQPISVLNWWDHQGIASLNGYDGAVWYRTKFSIPKINKNESVRLYFGSIDGNATVYINGHKQVERKLDPPYYKGWDKPFSTAVHHKWLNPDGTNILAVRVTPKGVGSTGITGGAALLGRVVKKKN